MNTTGPALPPRGFRLVRESRGEDPAADPSIAPDAGLAPAIETGRRPGLRRLAARGAFGLWIAGCLAVGGALLAPHLLTLPIPDEADPRLEQTVAAQRRPGQDGRWLVLHVLDEDCRCSQRVLDHLLTVPRPAGAVERVVLIAHHGASARAAEIRARGFDLDVVAPEQLGARYHLEAAPLLVIVDPDDEVRYLGGYTPRKQAADNREAEIIAATLRGERVAALPAFGCAVGARLREAVDPLGIQRLK